MVSNGTLFLLKDGSWIIWVLDDYPLSHLFLYFSSFEGEIFHVDGIN
jgi:hypothetical protein